jgi:hypothetical protein
MPYIDAETLKYARSIDLLTYLQAHEPHELVELAPDVFSTCEHDSVKISHGKWFRFKTREGGASAIDYLMTVRGWTFLQAAQSVLGHRAPARPPDAPPNPARSAIPAPIPRAFAPPPAHSDNRRVYAYLRSRGIDAEVIRHHIKHGRMYEDANRHNIVFVGFDGGTPRYAALRGTLSQTAFVGEAAGSDKRHSFSAVYDGGAPLFVFESAIDLLSAQTLIKMGGEDFRNYDYISLGGVSGSGRAAELHPALEEYLSKHDPKSVILCLDNDEAGRAATACLTQLLLERGIPVRDRSPSVGKDVNDELMRLLGVSGRVTTRGGSSREEER